MTAGRLAAYVVLAGWDGSLTVAWTDNLAAARWFPLAVNSVLAVLIIATVVVMAYRDYRAGRIKSR